MGWKPSLQFEEGLSKTIDWYLNNSEWLNDVTSGAYRKYYEKQYEPQGLESLGVYGLEGKGGEAI